MKFISRVPNFAEGIKGTVLEFNVLQELVPKLKVFNSEIVLNFLPTTTGFGNNVAAHAKPGANNEVLAAVHYGKDNKEVFGHVIGASYEVRRFLEDLKKAQEPNALSVGERVFFREEAVVIEWLSKDKSCGAGVTPSGRGVVFETSDAQLKKAI